MRVSASGVYEESGFRFDFSIAQGSIIHDKAEPEDGNTFWPGVDFRVFEPDEELWIEVKSWSNKSIIERAQRHHANRDYQQKLQKNKADEFRDDIVSKFLGTTSYLTWFDRITPDIVYYVVFLEPPNRGSRALLGPFQDRLRDEFKNAQARLTRKQIKYKVMDMEQFKKEFPQYAVVRI